jgi:transposase-like protein
VHISARSLGQLRQQLPNERACRRYLETIIWRDGRFCRHCGSFKSWRIQGPSARDGLYECADCHGQFTVTTKTPLHSTKLPLRIWIEAMFVILTSSKGVASVALARFIGVSQKTAWKMGHAIRLLMKEAVAQPMDGIVEVDEKYLGGNPVGSAGVI